MNLLLQRTIFRVSEAAKKYTILRNKFLIPTKPKRAATAYLLFSNERRPQHTGKITEIAGKIGAQWKQLSADQKKKYEDEAKILSEQHKKIADEYEQKYGTPFKNVNIANLGIKKLLAGSKGLKIVETGQKVKEYFNNLTQEDRKKLQQEVDKIRQERQQISKQFQIPSAIHKTERGYMMSNVKEKSITEISKQQRETLSKQYLQYKEDIQNQRKQFAKKFGMTTKELQEIIKLNQRRLRREAASDITVNHLDTPHQPVKRRTVKKTKKTVGKRVKKEDKGAKKEEKKEDKQGKKKEVKKPVKKVEKKEEKNVEKKEAKAEQ